MVPAGNSEREKGGGKSVFSRGGDDHPTPTPSFSDFSINLLKQIYVYTYSKHMWGVIYA